MTADLRDGAPASRPPTSPLSETLPCGTTVGRYVIVSVIGHGGMGVVYAAYDTKLDRKLAIKLLRRDLVHVDDTEEAESRLLREAQAMARLSHPNVVAVHDVGVHEGRVFLAMEFVEGVTLTEWLRTPRPLKARLAAMRDAGHGLAAAHSAGLVHRDFKPDNVFVSKGGRVVVFDFGLACARGDETSPAPRRKRESNAPAVAAVTQNGGSDALSCPLTLAGSVLGTVGFMAPEQAFGEAANPETDQFSFAATLYVALYGEKPFPERDIQGYLEQIESPVKEKLKGQDGKPVPAWLRRAALRGLSSDPKHRFPSMGAMLTALENDPKAAFRRTALRVGSALVIAATVAFPFYSAHQRARVCASDPSELRFVWDDGIRRAIGSAFERSSEPGAKELATRLSARFDKFAGEWTSMRESVCQATRVQKQQSEEVYRLRMECLERQKMSVRSLTALLVNADAKVVRKAVDITYGIPETSWCADVATLRVSAGLPDNPEQRAKVIEVRAKLAEAASLRIAGKYQKGKEVAEEAVAMARRADHSQTLAEALLADGDLRGKVGDHVASVPVLREAFDLALASGIDSVAVEAASGLAFATGTILQKSDVSSVWIETAHALLTRMGGNEELRLQLLTTEGAELDEVYWRPEEALPIQEQVVSAYRRLHGAHPKTAVALFNVGVSLTYLGEHARARTVFEESIRMNEEVGGTWYADNGSAEYMLGQSLLWLGEFQASEAHLKRSLDLSDANGMDYWSALALPVLAELETVRGNSRAAVTYGERAKSSLARADSPSELIPYVYVPLGEALIRAGRAREALPLCEQALHEQEIAAGGLREDKVYAWDALRCKGEALTALGRSNDAVEAISHSLKLKRRMFPADYPLAEFALARALPPDSEEGRTAFRHAESARDALAKYPFLIGQRREVDEWLESHRGAGSGPPKP